MYVPINSLSNLFKITTRSRALAFCLTRIGAKIFYLHLSVKRLDQCCLYFQIWYFSKSCFIFSTLALFMLFRLDTLNQVFTFRIKLEFFQSMIADRSVLSIMNVLCWYRERMFNKNRGKEFLLTFEHLSVKRLDQCFLYFQIWYFNKSCFISSNWLCLCCSGSTR